MKSYKQYLIEYIKMSSNIKSRILNSKSFLIGLEFEFFIDGKYFDVEQFHNDYVQSNSQIDYDEEHKTFILELLKLDIFKQFPYDLKFDMPIGRSKYPNWVITYDYTEASLIEIISPPLSPIDAIQAIESVNEFIKKYGVTEKDTAIQLTISHKSLYSNDILNINLMKLLLLIDEAQIYKLFSDREDSQFALSVNRLVKNFSSYMRFYLKDDIPSLWDRLKLMYLPISKTDFKNILASNIPTEHGFALDLSKLEKDNPRIEFRYLGGSGYETKTKQITNLLYQFCYIIEVSLNDNIKYNDIANKNLDDMYNKLLDKDSFKRKLYNFIGVRYGHNNSESE